MTHRVAQSPRVVTAYRRARPSPSCARAASRPKSSMTARCRCPVQRVRIGNTDFVFDTRTSRPCVCVVVVVLAYESIQPIHLFSSIYVALFGVYFEFTSMLYARLFDATYRGTLLIDVN